MGKVVVSDTNIFIDLMDIGLLDPFFNCGMEIHTTAMVIDEIKKEDQKNTLLGFRDLIVKKYKEDDFSVVFDYYSEASRYSNLSMTDCSVLLYAKELCCPLITNDGKLRSTAIGEGVEVMRLLSIINYMVVQESVSAETAKCALERLMQTNSRAPKDLIVEFIKKIEEGKK